MSKMQTAGYEIAFLDGVEAERQRIIKSLQEYFELTLTPDDEGKVTDNPEWDNGFQTAIALIKTNQMFQ